MKAPNHSSLSVSFVADRELTVCSETSFFHLLYFLWRAIILVFFIPEVSECENLDKKWVANVDK